MFSNEFIHKYRLLLLHLLGWSLYVIGDSLDHLAGGHMYFLPSIVCGISAFVVTGLVGYGHHINRNRPVWVQTTFFVVSLYLVTALWHKLWATLHRLTGTTIEQEWQKYMDYSLWQWLKVEYYPLFLFAAWGGLFLAARFYLESRDKLLALQKSKLETKQSQLATLRYQLNPHFLFNVLNSIDVSVLSNEKDTAHKMIQHLSKFLRSSLEQGEQDKVPLKTEMAIVNDFINIEKLRFQDAIHIDIFVESDVEQTLVPSMILQPLIENAIRFAWSQSETGFVKVLASRKDHQCHIEIINFKSADYKSKGTGTGIRNCRERLELVYGKDAQLLVDETDEQFALQLILPLELDSP